MTIDPVSLAITVALTAAQMALAASKKIEGPRLEDLSVTLADYGTPIPRIWGTRRLEGCPIIWAEEIREQKRRRKTKGGKFNEYTYYGTWAVLVAGHEIDAVLKMYFDKRLIYDVTGSGPVTPISARNVTSDEASGLNLTSYIRIYLGTETQEPDPRMLATVEAEHGAGSCPAYRGFAYIVFEDVPLEKFGNRIPQITVEATDSATAVYPHEEFDVVDDPPTDLIGFSWAPDYSRFMFGGSGSLFEIYDAASRTLMSSGAALSGAVHGISTDGTIYSVRDTLLDPHVMIRTPDGLTSGGADIPLDHICSFAQVIADGEGEEYCCVTPFGNQQNWIQYFHIGGTASPVPTSIEAEFSPSMYLRDDAGNVWAAGGPLGPSDQIGFHCIAGDRAGEHYLITAPSTHAGTASVKAVHNGAGSFVVSHNNKLFLVDDETFAIGTTVNHTTHASDLPRFAGCPPGADSIWLRNEEISLTTLATIRTVSYSDWGAGAPGERVIYDPVNHALIIFPTSTSLIQWLYLDRAGSNDVLLSTVIGDVADLCGIEAADIDATDCDQPITGYSITQGSGKDAIDPLLDLHDVDARPHNFVYEFLKRGNASAGTLDVVEFVRQGEEPRYTIPIILDTDLPASATLSFADVDADQQTNTIFEQRAQESTDSNRAVTLNMTTWASDVDTARSLGKRFFRRKWNGTFTYQLGLTASRLAMEPADVWTLGLDGETHTARLKKLTITGKENVLKTEWERDFPALNILPTTSGAAMDGRRDQVISVPQISKGFVLDIPLIRDADNDVNPILYFGAGPYAEGTWPGATFYRSADGVDYEEEFASVPSTAGLTWGFANGVLASSSVAVWDRGNTVSVTVKNGTLTSATEAECNANPTLNLALLGDELLQFTTATLTGSSSNGDTYTLSGFKRGRRGTEWAVGTHAASEQFVLLDAVGNEEMGASDIGDMLYFKAVTDGRDIESAFPITLTYEGESHIPYAPAHLTAGKDAGSGDWFISWRRRSRIGYRWTGGSTVPLGESAENYEVDILDGPGGSVVRTITATSETATYTSAQQVTDGGDVPAGDLDIRVRQVGDLMDGRNTIGAF